MTKTQQILLAVMRVSMGWMMFYAGLVKVLDPEWSAAGYLQNAKTFTGFFQWLTQPDILPVINFVNEWGLTLLGVSLILGLFVRLSSILGSVLMFLYYLPILTFPMVASRSFIVDDHIIFISVLLFFAAIHAGRYYGLYNWCSRLPICSKVPKLREWLG